MQSDISYAPAMPFVFRDVEVRSFAAKPKPDTWGWSKKNMRMIDGPLKGHLWNPDLAPHGKGIMEAYDTPHVRVIYFIAPSQTGKTVICFCCFFSSLTTRPDNWGIGMPDEKTAKSVFQDKLHKYFESIQVLRKLLKDGKDSLQSTEIMLGDCQISAMWAGSEASMRSKSMPYVMPDEPDAYPDQAALNTMLERMDAYYDLELSKAIIPCRPKGMEEQSVTWTDAKIKAQAWMQWAARCPACQELQVMDHTQIIPIDGSHDPKRIRMEKTGRYQCVRCRYPWNDSTRNLAVRSGQWVNILSGEPLGERRKANDFGDASIVAYHFRSWESPLVSLSSVLAEWFEAQGKPRLLQQFDNNRCAKPYRFVQLETDWEALREYRLDDFDQGVVPEWAVALTVAVDMQQDHFYYSMAAHGILPERIHILDYGKVMGGVKSEGWAQDEYITDWMELTKIVFEQKYFTASGRGMAPWRGALDTGGGRDRDYEDSRTMQAYQWLMRQRPGVIFGTKGMSRRMPGQMVDVRAKEQMADGRKLRNGFTLHFIDTDAFKRSIFWSLSEEGYEEEPITFHARTDENYLKQIASEKLEKGRDGKETWVRKRENHYLDCMVLHKAMACWQWKPGLAQLALAASGREEQEREEAGEGSALFDGRNLYRGGV